MVLAAAVIGVAYNSLSQLGIPLRPPDTNVPPPEPDRSAYTAAAISMRLQPAPGAAVAMQPAIEPKPAPAAAASTGGVYSNETMAVNIVPLQPPAGQNPPTAVVAPGAVAPGAVAGNPYKNETIAVKQVPPPAPPPEAPAVAPTATNPYKNETIAVRPLTTAAPQPVPVQDAPKPTAITWQEAKQMIATGETVLVDARPLVAFQAGSIPGAVSLPSNRIKDEMPEFMKKYGTDRWLIIYCSDKGCASSEQVATILMREYGYQHVFHMPGGYAEWRIAETSQPKSVGQKQ